MVPGIEVFGALVLVAFVESEFLKIAIAIHSSEEPLLVLFFYKMGHVDNPWGIVHVSTIDDGWVAIATSFCLLKS